MLERASITQNSIITFCVASVTARPSTPAPDTLRPWCSDVCVGHIEGRVDDQDGAR
jgi:hypothetical protein